MNNLTGRVFGRLTVIAMTDLRKSRQVVWRCVCECGNEKLVASRYLIDGDSKSCGCLKVDTGKASTSLFKVVHGEAAVVSAEYRCWAGVLTRCNNTNHGQYASYGGRGITVCDRWDPKKGGSFENFLEDVGRRPSEKHSIDRLDNDDMYAAWNCRWATKKEQAQNRRKPDPSTYPRAGRPAKMIEHNGETLPLREWLTRQGVLVPTYYARIHRGLTPLQALGLE